MPRNDESDSAQTLDLLCGVAAVYVVINHTRGHFFVRGNAIFNETSSAALSLFDYAALAMLQLTSLGTQFVILFFCFFCASEGCPGPC